MAKHGYNFKELSTRRDDDDGDAHWNFLFADQMNRSTQQEDKDVASTATETAKTDIPRPKKVRRSSFVEVYFAGSLRKSTSPAISVSAAIVEAFGSPHSKKRSDRKIWTFDVHVPNFGALRVDFAARRPFFPCSADVRQLVVLESSSSCSRWSLSRFSGAIGGRFVVKVSRVLHFGSFLAPVGILCALTTSSGCHVHVPALDNPSSILFPSCSDLVL